MLSDQAHQIIFTGGIGKIGLSLPIRKKEFDTNKVIRIYNSYNKIANRYIELMYS